MKKISTIIALSLAFTGIKAQSTIPTTTVNGSLRVTDSLQVTNDIRSTGDISTSGNMTAAAFVASGEVTATDTMRAKKDVLVDGNAVIHGELNVGSQATFRDNVAISKSILFNNANEFSYTPATTGINAKFYLGSTAFKTLPLAITCPNPNINALPQFINNGAFISHVPTGSGSPNVNASLSMYTAPWDGSGIIDVAGTDNNGFGNNGLLVNYFCHRNTLINTGWDLVGGVDGGSVFMGAKVDMQKSLKIGWSSTGVIDLNTSIEINQSTPNAKGVNLKTWETTVKAFAIEHTDGSNPFVVYGDGKTHIGKARPKTSGVAQNAMLSVDGLILAKEVRVAVSTATHWADDVFDKSYKLKTLEQVEQYIHKNKHLPDVPSADEVVANGFDVNQISATLLRKIEELTLYTIDLKKQVDAQQKEINTLKNK